MQLSGSSRVFQEERSGLIKWRKPPDGWIKINYSSLGVINGCIGIGCVIPDSYGSFIGARCCRI